MLIVTDVLRDYSKRKQIKAKKNCTRLFVHHDKNYWSLWLQVCRHTPQCSMSGFTNIMHWRLWSEEGVAVDNLTPNFVQSKGKKKEKKKRKAYSLIKLFERAKTFTQVWNLFSWEDLKTCFELNNTFALKPNYTKLWWFDSSLSFI